jgi:cobalt-zinc-cadmium efflux system protein
MHNHSHSHHHHDGEVNEKNLIFTIVLNGIITVVEVVGGIVSGSLSLLSDALHNFSDALAVLVSLLALKISRKERTPQKTFGYKRAEILAALLNSTVLVVISLFLFKEAYLRFFEPVEIKGMVMGIVALVGLLANLLAVLLLHKDAGKNINVKSAYLHLVSDTLSSVVVLIGGVFIYFFKIYWIDPLFTILIGLYILYESYDILKDSVNILMQATPPHLEIERVQGAIESIDGVDDCHHIHIWQLTDKEIHFEAHVRVGEDFKVSEAEVLSKRIKALLSEQFQISHATLQFEYDSCKARGYDCL